MRLFPGCFHTWNLDCESVFTFFQQYGWFLVFMAECVKCRVGTFLGLMTASGLPSLVALYGLMAFMAMTGCCRGEISGFMAEKNGCCSWACGDAAGLVKSLRHTQRLEMDAVKAPSRLPFWSYWCIAGVQLERLSRASARWCGKQQRHRQSRCKSSTSACKCVLSEIGQRAAAASAAALRLFGFTLFVGHLQQQCASVSSVSSDSMQQQHRQPRSLARVLRFCWERKSPSFSGFLLDYFVILEWFLAGKIGVMEFVNKFSQFGKGKEKRFTHPKMSSHHDDLQASTLVDPGDFVKI